MRRGYPIQVTINGRSLKRVLIDSHHEVRHGGSMSDALILELVKHLDGEERQVEAVTPSGFEVFRVDPIYWKGKVYRLVLTLPPADQEGSDYIGVINAFRVRDRKRKEE